MSTGKRCPHQLMLPGVPWAAWSCGLCNDAGVRMRALSLHDPYPQLIQSRRVSLLYTRADAMLRTKYWNEWFTEKTKHFKKPGEREKSYERGIIGSKTEDTWNGHIHTCCQSMTGWRHKVKCPRVGDGSLPPDE